MDVIFSIILLVVCTWLFFVRRFGSGPRTYTTAIENSFPEARYERKISKVPIVRGSLMKAASTLLNSAIGNYFVTDLMLKLNNMTFFRTRRMNETPTFYPVVSFDGEPVQPAEFASEEEVKKCISTVDKNKDEPQIRSICEYREAYEEGSVTPSEVVEKILESFFKAKGLNSIVQYNEDEICKMAEASTRRYLDNKPLSVIDGVPFVVKDELSVAGYKYSCGTSFLGSQPEKCDCEVVARLRSLGGIIVGISNMHELGLGTTGCNPSKGFGAARNPYNMECYTGGSSSGSASAVAMGICGAALGTDGGGSVRIPASYCGVVGLKPTFGRISSAGLRQVAVSVAHIGPLCTTVKDAALLYSLLAFPDPKHSLSLNQPPIKIPDFAESIDGLKIGIYEDYFKDCDEDVHNVCQNMVKSLERERGCVIKSIGIPELDDAKYAHLIIILSEMCNAIQYEFDHNLDDLTTESQILFAIGRKITAVDFLQASKQRTRSINFFKKLFEEVDVIITPTTAHTAPRIHPDDLIAGSIDIERDFKSMRFMYLGNLLGNPCISVPAGYDQSGMPVGLQIMGAWWREDVILKVAHQVESLTSRKLPSMHFDILGKR